MIIEFINVKTDGLWSKKLQASPWVQILIGALMGVIPGCLGTYTIVSLYIHRVVNFPALMAALIATAGDEAFRLRAMEIYPAINDLNMSRVRFELSKIMFDNIELFMGEAEQITHIYMIQCLDKICSGENIDLGNPFADISAETAADIAAAVKADMSRYMEMIRVNYNDITDKNKLTLLQLFGNVKRASAGGTWKELFKNKEDLKLFILMASQLIITGTGLHAFTNISGWQESDLAELVAYFDSSTQDKFLKKSCRKYIAIHPKEDWEKYGVMLEMRPKTEEEQEKATEKIQRMLQKVGYIPYQKGSYSALKGEVADDMRNSNAPLLISRLLSAVYRWQGTYGNQMEAEKNAKAVRDYLLEIRKKQTTLYNFIIPKLALEIIESSGHYHEVMINTSTMPPSFWNWFLIGYNRCRGEDDKLLTYTRVYTANKNRMSRVPVKKQLREVFQEVAE